MNEKFSSHSDDDMNDYEDLEEIGIEKFQI